MFLKQSDTAVMFCSDVYVNATQKSPQYVFPLTDIPADCTGVEKTGIIASFSRRFVKNSEFHEKIKKICFYLSCNTIQLLIIKIICN